MKHILACCIFCSLLACKSLPAQDSIGNIIRQHEYRYLCQLFNSPVPAFFNATLYMAVSDWLGVPYRYAGTTLKGVDCSAFVRCVMRDAFGIDAQGNSGTLYAQSLRVRKKNLEQGDLVFFKTRNRRVSHVGIYLGDNKFAHSSRSNGVIVSDMDNVYYKTRYAGGGRLRERK